MTGLIMFPFTIRDGSVVVSDDESDEYIAGELAHLAMTRTGERELVPDFGIEDPVFSRFDDIDYTRKALTFCSQRITIASIKQKIIRDGLRQVVVQFDTSNVYDGSTSTGNIPTNTAGDF